MIRKLLLIAIAIFTLTGTSYGRLALGSAKPNSAKQGTKVTVHVFGYSFYAVSFAEITNGKHSIYGTNKRIPVKDSLLFDLTISSTADTGWYNLIVSDSVTGTDTLPNAFRVIGSGGGGGGGKYGAKLTSISPSSGKQGTTVYATIKGSASNFDNTTTANIGGAITCTVDSIISKIEIMVHFTIPSTFNTGSYKVNTYDATDGAMYMDSFVVDTTIAPHYYLNGHIKTSGGSPLGNSWVYLITYDSTDSTVTAIDSMKTDSNGYYNFTLASATNVFIYAMPNSSYPHEIPTYDDSADYVLNGTLVSVGSGTTTVNFNTLSGTNPGGTGFIGGKVSYCSLCKKGGPVEGLKILLTDMSGNVQAVTFTDVNGNFSFKNISLQQYKFMVDMPKINNSSAPSVTLTSTVPSQSKLSLILYTKVLDLDNASITTGINDVPNVASGISIYPNPFSSNLNVSYSLNNASEVSVRIVYITGREVYRTSEGRQIEGTHSLSLDQMNSLPSVFFQFLFICCNNIIFIQC